MPAIASVARRAGAVTIMDNTWASPLYFKPFAHGVDVSVQAATKYIAGHSDVMLGTITATEAAYPPLQQAILEFGLCASPDDVFLAMRGLRTLHARLPHHERSGLAVAAWLRNREEVAEVIHPGLPGSRGHDLWKRDFLGAAGLFAFVLRPELSDERRLAAMLDGMRLFGMGYSWGGFESLLLPLDPPSARTATAWPPPGIAAGQLMRASIGLESVDDLIADLAAGFERLRGEAGRGEGRS